MTEEGLQNGAHVYTSKAKGEKGVQVDTEVLFWYEDCIIMCNVLAVCIIYPLQNARILFTRSGNFTGIND
jgi:hypothetical protein